MTLNCRENFTCVALAFVATCLASIITLAILVMPFYVLVSGG